MLVLTLDNDLSQKQPLEVYVINNRSGRVATQATMRTSHSFDVLLLRKAPIEYDGGMFAQIDNVQ